MAFIRNCRILITLNIFPLYFSLYSKPTTICRLQVITPKPIEATTVNAPACKDEETCKAVTINNRTCRFPGIRKACYESCSNCCHDDSTCEQLGVNKAVCELSDGIRKLCPKSCQECGDNKKTSKLFVRQ